MVLSVLYVAFQRVLQLVFLLFRSSEFKELEIVVLRHDLAVLRRQVGRPTFRSADRWFLAATARMMPSPRGERDFAERFVRTVWRECIDWLLIVSTQHLERALTVFIDHYNVHRAHRSLELAPPNGRPVVERWSGTQPMAVNRRDRLGGLVHEYERAA